ncbi:helix-turn-helix domain-containing protein [Faecalibacillus intestinalis]|uniref:helix-turn-helix domain-containing protein n=1 Tax=Faecalibacillus intestinalis TaxID=1982626 RepID=UPI0018A89940|nr:helix-turn-helix transcriptional regulator [Faecalibacillus intestinalis]
MNLEDIKNRTSKISLYDELLKYKTLGERLKYLRTSYKNLSMQEFSKDLKISRSYVYFYENNENKPKSDRLQKIADYYDVTTYVLDSDKETLLSVDDYDIIHQIFIKIWDETTVNNKKNISKLDFSNITVSICDTLLYIISIIDENDKKEFFEYFVNSLLIDTKNLDANEKSITHFLNDLKRKAMNVEENNIHLDFLFRNIENSLYLKTFNQKTFNELLKRLSKTIEILFF